jgi:hypothetical protein
MTQVRCVVRRKASNTTEVELDLRTPQGRRLPF